MAPACARRHCSQSPQVGRHLPHSPKITDPAVLVARCDPRLIEETRRNWPFLRDRRIDAYAPILSRYLGAA